MSVPTQIDRIWEFEYPILEANLQQFESILAQLESRAPTNFDFLKPKKLAVPANFKLEQR